MEFDGSILEILRPQPDEDGDPIWWIDPPHSPLGGGQIDRPYTNPDNWSLYGNGRYCKVGIDFISTPFERAVDITDANAHIKFSTGGLLDTTIDSAILWIKFYGGFEFPEGETDDFDIAVYHTISQSSDDFPQAALDGDDWGSSQVLINDSWQDIQDLIADVDASTDTAGVWRSLDVTAEVQNAVNGGWPWLAFSLKPNPLYPSGWDYEDPPISTMQNCYILFHGPATEISSTWDLPPGFPPSAAMSGALWAPWLNVSFTGGPEQPEPGEGESGEGLVLSIAADIKTSKVAFAGTDTGNLWKTTDGGENWTKAFEVD